MRNNETGEFELVVGNRQLLSGFFIVVLLFAVAFAMGYVVGQNSPRSAKVAAESASAAAPPSDSPRPQPAAPIATPPTPAAATAAPPETDAPPQPTTQPAREPERASAPAAPAASPVVTELPGPPGSFWQVMAVPQPEADLIVKTLKTKGFNAFLNPGPNNLMRVLVGPYADTAAMGKAKTDLENAGFARPIRK